MDNVKSTIPRFFVNLLSKIDEKNIVSLEMRPETGDFVIVLHEKVQLYTEPQEEFAPKGQVILIGQNKSSQIKGKLDKEILTFDEGFQCFFQVDSKVEKIKPYIEKIPGLATTLKWCGLDVVNVMAATNRIEYLSKTDEFVFEMTFRSPNYWLSAFSYSHRLDPTPSSQFIEGLNSGQAFEGDYIDYINKK